MDFVAFPIIFGKEISMEDVRLSIEKLPDRFVEHPNLVFVVSNLHYAEASSLTSKNRNRDLEEASIDTWILMEACNESARRNIKISVKDFKKKILKNL